MENRAAKIAALLPQVEGKPAPMIQLARLMRQDGQKEAALALVRRALALAPEDARLAAEARGFLSEDVPGWHFRIVRDQARNAAYDAALRRAVTPRSRVLEIGAGSGLLAMMAARAGAAEVVTCEMNPSIAEAATQIVARNGFADRVRVVARHSDTLDAEADLGGRVDVLVSEIVSDDLLSEDVLPAHERAVRNLLKPGGVVIPARGRVRVALAEDLRDDETRLGLVDGFDVSPLNALRSVSHTVRVGEARLQLRSDAADLFAFDFGAASYCAPAATTLACRSSGGRVNGVAQWIALELDGVTNYENRPALGAASCWAAMFHRFPAGVETSAGDELRICGAHDRHRISIWRDG